MVKVNGSRNFWRKCIRFQENVTFMEIKLTRVTGLVQLLKKPIFIVCT